MMVKDSTQVFGKSSYTSKLRVNQFSIDLNHVEHFQLDKSLFNMPGDTDQEVLVLTEF